MAKEKKAPEVRMHSVSLVKGATFTTPWGEKLQKGRVKDLASSDPHFSYFKGNTRFKVENQRVDRRAPARKRPMGRRRKDAMESEGKKLAQEREKVATRAKELGIKLTSGDTVESVKKKILAAENEARRGRAAEDGKENGKGKDGERAG